MASPTIPMVAPDDRRGDRDDTAAFHALVRRLSEQSVRKHFDACSGARTPSTTSSGRR